MSNTARANGSGGSELDIRPAWHLADPGIERDAKAFWKRLGVLDDKEADRRVSELTAMAYSGGAPIGVATAFPERLEMLRARFAIFRCLVPAAEHRSEVARQLAVLSHQLLEPWALANPKEQIMGMATMIPVAEYKERRAEPVWPDGGLNLNLVGYMRDGSQLRVAWFRHAEVS